MAQVFMIRKKTDGNYVCGSARYPYLNSGVGRIFYSLRSAKMFVTKHLAKRGIKTWDKGRYKFNAGEFFTPSNIMLDCEIVTVELNTVGSEDIFDMLTKAEMKAAPKGKKKKSNPNG